MKLKRLPIGMQTFSELIEKNYLYVDKTEWIYRLINGSGKFFFLSRPRRFGKSLLVSTLKEIFSGRRQLFKGLWLENQLDWKEYHHPVIHIDFSGKTYAGAAELSDTLLYLIKKNAAHYGVILEEKGYDKCFEELILKLKSFGQVVVLIDEYDKPIIDFIDKPKIAAENRDMLRNFYGTLKAMDEHLRFVFLTGVSKFSNVSVFSGLNNLNDISLDKEYAAVCGYTSTELIGYFKPYLRLLTASAQPADVISMEMIREWYNGYSWDGNTYIYNPFSVLNLLEKKSIQNYWFSSGTPTFLIKTLIQNRMPIEQLDDFQSTPLLLEAWDIDQMNIPSLLFQTGYLTIKKIRDIPGGGQILNLSYPNREVKEAFLSYMLGEFSHTPAHQSGVTVFHLRQALESNDIEQFITILKSVYAGIHYNVAAMSGEGHYHAVFYTIFTLLGLQLHSEIQTNKGRIDAVVETGRRIFIIEFKIGTASDALAQIHEKGYAEKFQSGKKAITLLGIGFDQKLRNISDWNHETGSS
jgi:hypothetical protein